VAFLGAISEREKKSRTFKKKEAQEDGDNGGKERVQKYVRGRIVKAA
jgi:hypothetical protein